MVTAIECIVSVTIGVFCTWMLVSGFVKKHLQLLKLPKIPLPHYPVIGQVLGLPTDPNGLFRTLEKLFQKQVTFKEKMCVLWIGMRPNILVIHPDGAEALLKSSKNIQKARNYNLLRSWIQDGLLLSTGKKWHKRRKMITPSFHFDLLKDFLCVMNEQAAVCVDSFKTLISNGDEIDIQKQMKLCTLDIICETAMGCKIDAQKKESNDYVKDVNRMAEYVGKRVLNPLFRSETIFNLTSSGRQQQKTLESLHKFTMQVIRNRLLDYQTTKNITSHRKAFLDMLVGAKLEDGSSLSAEDIQEEVDTFMFAGHDTTSVALTWAIYLLGLYPEKQKKLHEELDSVFGGDNTCDITFDHIKDLNYLDLVIKEVLRLYPSVPYFAYNLGKECVIDGHVIPKGQDVSVSVYFIHRHPEIWDKPSEFIPERFETENRLQANRSPYAYIPFSAGSRNCIGQRFALQELKVILAKLFREFSVISFDKEDEIKVGTVMVLQLDQRVNVKFEKRDTL